MANDNVSALLALKTGRSDGDSEYAVLYTEQELTALQKAQARKNIAAPAADGGDVSCPCIKALLSDSEGVIVSGGYDIYDVANIELAGSVNDEAVRIRGVASPALGVDAANKQYVDGTKVTDSSSTSITLDSAADNTVYEYGELTSLTITNPPATGEYTIVFTSGSTPTVTTIPSTILGLESFSAEANTLYEINVLDNRAVVGSWAVSSA